MKEKLFIPKKCKVGFNIRPDTYTGMLGYVIYHDGKIWRKEQSWEGWREKHVDSEKLKKDKETAWQNQIKSLTKYWEEAKKNYEKNDRNSIYYADAAKKTLEEYLKSANCDTIDNFRWYSHKRESNNPALIPIEFDNVPTEGFVLNKKAGGYSSGWNHRQTYCRIYDPRGFEFEITIPNLLFILEECNSNKGKGLEGEFVYSWDGKDLVLLPTSSPDFKSSSYFTNAQSKKVSAKDLKPGFIYETKQLQNLVFLGKFDLFEEKNIQNPARRSRWSRIGFYVEKTKKNIFYNIASKTFEGLSSLTSIASEKEQSNEYAELIEKYKKTIHSSGLITGFVEKEVKKDFRENRVNYNYGSYLEGFVKEGDTYYYAYLTRSYKDNWSWLPGVNHNNNREWYNELYFTTKITFKDGKVMFENLDKKNYTKKFISKTENDNEKILEEHKEILSKLNVVKLYIKYESGFEKECPTY